MLYIEWNDDYSVKVKLLDEQHQYLIKILNKLHEAMKKGNSKTVLSNTLDQLIQYSVEHFNSEEQLLDQYNYPQANTHKDEHKKFVNEVQKFKQGFDSGKMFVSIELMDFLKNWLIKHIQGTDKQYSSFLNLKGVS